MSGGDFPLMHEVCEDVVDSAFEDSVEIEFLESEATNKEQKQNLLDSQDDVYDEEMAKASWIFQSFFSNQ